VHKYIIAWILMFLASQCIAQQLPGHYEVEGATRTPVDSLKIKDYTLYWFDYLDSAGYRYSILHPMSIYKIGKEFAFIDACVFLPYNFKVLYPSIGHDQYYWDINRDGLDEIAVRHFSGGANCCFGVNIYSLSDTVALIFSHEPDYYESFDIVDLDQDSVLEIITHDTYFGLWMGLYKHYTPPLIWRWKDGKYNLANNDFSDYALKDLNLTDITRNDFWNLAIYYFYAGKWGEVDSIFNIFYIQNPDTTFQKNYRNFKDLIKHNPLYPQE